MSQERDPEAGLLSTATHLLRTLRHTVSARVELFLLEAREDRLKLFDALCLGVIAVMLALMALIVVTFTIVVFFWDTYRLAALLCLAAGYSAGAAVVFAKLRARLKNWQSFPATLQQIEKDRACFKQPN